MGFLETVKFNLRWGSVRNNVDVAVGLPQGGNPKIGILNFLKNLKL